MTPEQLQDDWHGQLPPSSGTRWPVWQGEIAQAREVTAREAVAFAVEHCFYQYSVVPERELQRRCPAARHGLRDAGADRSPSCHRHGVFVQEIDGRRMATTEALQAEEDDIARFAVSGRGTLRAVGVAKGLDRTLADGKRLSDEQWRVVTGLLESEDRVNLVEGPAGAGKSSLLAKFDEGMRQKGRSVTYLGTTAKAAEVLERTVSRPYRRPLPGRSEDAAGRRGRRRRCRLRRGVDARA